MNGNYERTIQESQFLGKYEMESFNRMSLADPVYGLAC